VALPMTANQKVKKRMKKDDGIKEGALLPIHDVVVVDRLRKKLKVRDYIIKELGATLEAKNALIEAQAKEIASLKQQVAV
jgi:hypothetical protein